MPFLLLKEELILLSQCTAQIFNKRACQSESINPTYKKVSSSQETMKANLLKGTHKKKLAPSLPRRTLQSKPMKRRKEKQRKRD